MKSFVQFLEAKKITIPDFVSKQGPAAIKAHIAANTPKKKPKEVKILRGGNPYDWGQPPGGK